MSASVAAVATPLARRYMGQLCKHFAHRLPVELAEDSGSIGFPMGTCTLVAEPERLVLRAEAADEAGRAQLEGVVARHLERFAFRAPLSVVWTAIG